MRLCTIPPHLPFLDTLAARWLRRARRPVARALSCCPRAAPPGHWQKRSCGRRTGGRCCCRASPRSGRWTRRRWRWPARSICRPRLSRCSGWRMLAADPGAADGDGRRAAHARIAPGCWPRELASLMDEAERAGIDLAAAPAGCRRSRRMRRTGRTRCSSCDIVTAVWPAWLADNGADEPGGAAGRAAARHRRGRGRTQPAGRAGADRRHHGRHSRRSPAAAGRRADAARAGGAAATRPRAWPRRRGTRWTIAMRRPVWRACWPDLDATRGDVRTWHGAAPGAVPPARSRCCPARCCRRGAATIGRDRRRRRTGRTVAAARRPTAAGGSRRSP